MDEQVKLTLKEWYTVQAAIDCAIQTYEELASKTSLPDRSRKQFLDQAFDAQVIYNKITEVIG